MASGRRHLTGEIQLTRRAWEDVAPQLEDWLKRLWDSTENGIPSGFNNTVPQTITVGSVGDPGLETAGWAAADHDHPVVTGVPSGLANANDEGTSEAVPRLDHKHKRDVRVQEDAGDTGTRNALNFTHGIDTVDDAINDRVDVAVDEGELDHGLLEATSLLDNDHPLYHRKHGFEVASDGSRLVTISYDETTRVVTITPTGATFRFWIDGVQYIKTGAQAASAHAAATANYYVTYDSSGNLQVSSSIWSILNRASTPVALVYYHASLADGVCFYECHTADRVLEFHYNLHHSRGTQYISGGDITGYTLNTDSDAGVTYAIAAAVIADEDIKSTCGPTADGGPYTIFWRDGATGIWTWTDTDSFPFKFGTTFPSYNQYTGATWQLTELSGLGLGQWVNYYVLAVPAVDTVHQIVIIPGQNLYTSLASAQSAAFDSDVSPGGAIFPFQEIRGLWKVTLHALGTYAGTHQCRIEAVASIKSSSVILLSTGAGGITDHGALTGLADDDHAQYQLRSEQGAASGYPTLDGSAVVVEPVQLYRQGLDAAVPALAEGELYWATDTDTLYVGT